MWVPPVFRGLYINLSLVDKSNIFVHKMKKAGLVVQVGTSSVYNLTTKTVIEKNACHF